MGKRLTDDSRKSIAKVAGVKSTFVNGDKVIMTSFGRGNEAVIEKHISEKKVENVSKTPKYNAEDANASIEVSWNKPIHGVDRQATSVNNPTYIKDGMKGRQIGQDQIGLKDRFEERFFGKTYDDNFHIQLIYNILDMEKILAVFMNNIIYSIDNLIRKDNDGSNNLEDTLGYVFKGLKLPYSEFVKNEEYKEKFEEIYMNKRIGYFGNAFYRSKPDEKKKGSVNYVKKSREEVYNILAILSEVRNFTTHDDDFKERSQVFGRSSIYNFDSRIPESACLLLDTLYKEQVDNLNASFVKNASKSNLRFLFDALDAKEDSEKERIAQKYYQFSVTKSYKNLGFSITSLREVILEKYLPEVKKDKRWDSYRSKVYSMLDFLIWDHYTGNKKDQDDIVDRLRTTVKNSQKETVYLEEAPVLWSKIKEKYMKVYNAISTVIEGRASLKDYALSKADMETVNYAINVKGKAIDNSASRFSEMIYLLTLFLDGKEINDLLTTLVNKFDNIQSLMNVMKKEKIEWRFTEDYQFFNDENFFIKGKTCQVLKELKIINSISKMSTEIVLTKQDMFRDAVYLLDSRMSEDEVDDYIQGYFLDADLMRARNHVNAKGEADTGFRNFIINNLIESWRFRYIVRYANPKKIGALTQNESIIRLVLNDIPDTQIDRYYASCTGLESTQRKEKISYLTSELMSITVNTFETVIQSPKDQTENAQKQRFITLMSLYLNIIYQVTKNLVNINSRYVMAFHAVERDGSLYYGTSNAKKISHHNRNYTQLSREEIEKKRAGFLQECEGKGDDWRRYYKQLLKKERVINYCQQNLDNADEWMISMFRNDVAHMNAIRNAQLYIDTKLKVNSYYSLYHYLIQCSLQQAVEDMKARGKNSFSNPVCAKYLKDIHTYHSYSKDFVKALCTPFIYNLARYKNLVVEGLFDMNRPGETKYLD